MHSTLVSLSYASPSGPRDPPTPPHPRGLPTSISATRLTLQPDSHRSILAPCLPIQHALLLFSISLSVDRRAIVDLRNGVDALYAAATADLSRSHHLFRPLYIVDTQLISPRSSGPLEPKPITLEKAVAPSADQERRFEKEYRPKPSAART